MRDYMVEKPIVNQDACVQEMTTSEIVKEIRKELMEPILCLSQIRLALDGEVEPDRKMDEPRCLHDEIQMIEHMSVDCIGLSHAIHDKMFRNNRV